MVPSPQKRLDVLAAADPLWQENLLPSPRTDMFPTQQSPAENPQAEREAEGREEQEQSKVLAIERAPSSSLEKRPLLVLCALE